MCTHLYRRVGGTYYFRRAIPAHLRHTFDGRREWIESLRTKDRREAKRLVTACVLAFDDAVRIAAKSLVATDPSSIIAETAAIPVPVEYAANRGSGPLKAGSPTLPLLATFEAYAKEQGIKPATSAEWRSMLKALIAFVGHDNAAALTAHDLDKWRDSLLTNPGRKGRLRKPETVKDKYLCCVRATLAWAVEKRLLHINVATSVKVRVPKQVKVRERDFTGDEATAILSASMRTGIMDSTYEGRARRWVPWLCAYTGARVNEVGQLRGADIRQVDGIWCMLLTPDAGTIKNNTSRLVPLHLDLIEQGFVVAAAAQGGGPIFYDASRIQMPGASNRYYKKVGERLRDWVRNEVGIDDPAVQPNHGWRHTFKTRAIDAGVPERVADAIQGHAPRSVGQGYGSVSLGAKAKAINSMPRFIVNP